MRNFTFLAVMFCLFGLWNIANAQIVNIPDANFKAALVGNASINTNGDSEIQTSEAAAFTGSLSVVGLSISDLTGIEAFTAITYLACNYNQLTSLNLSANTALTNLQCTNNQLSSLDLSANTALTMLTCNGNNLTNLNLSSNTALKGLFCEDNQLTSLTLSPNSTLNNLWCYNNQITSLDLSANTALTNMSCYNNLLTSLNLSGDTSLFSLYCYDNQLSSLDLSTNTAITYLECGDNQLTSLDLSANTALTNLSCYNNLLTSLNLPPSTSLTDLRCFMNQLTTLDVSANNNLTDFNCSFNQLSNLDISANPALTNLDCSFNQLSSLDLFSNNNLTDLNCSDNPLQNLLLFSNSDLSNLNCSHNQLTDLYLFANPALTNLDCSGNQLANLDISSNSVLTSLICYWSQLTSLDLSENSALNFLDCRNNQLTSLNLSANVALTFLWCNENQLSSLDIKNGNNIYISSFYAINNPNLNCIQVDDSAWSTTNWTNIDAVASFSENCNPCIPTSSSQTFVECAGFSVTVGTNIYNSTGIFTDVLVNAAGCDSTVTTNLTINPSYTESISATICNSSYILGSQTLTTSGNYTEIFQTVNGCDSTVNLTLSEVTAFNENISSSICEGDSYILGTQTLSSSGVYSELLTSINGCDSTVNLTLTVNQPTSSSQTFAECDGYSVNVGTNIYSTTGVYSDTLVNIAGCDSIVTTDLIIKQPTSSTQAFVECAGFSITVGTKTYNETGIYNDTLINLIGCDSIVTTDLIINQPTSSSQTFVEDEGFYITVGTNNYNTTGIYTDVLTDSNGCDSTVITTLTIVPPCVVTIPDANFKNYLLNNLSINTNNDGEIQCSEASTFSGTIDCRNLNISDLTGIEAFTALTMLVCVNNQLTSLDLSSNIALTALWCHNNLLTSLELSGNTQLFWLFCYDNQLTSLDISANTALIRLECYNNQLTSLNLSANTVLNELSCFSNQLTSLDLSTNTALSHLYCESNQLTNLNLSANTALTWLYCNDNQLTSLGLSANTALTDLTCYSNQLTSLDLSANTALTHLSCFSNQLTILNIKNGNNINLAGFGATGNPSLTCIQVDNVAFMNSNWSSSKDNGASYSLNCNYCYPTSSSQTFVECAGFSITVGTNTYNTTGVYTDVLVNAAGCDSIVTTDLTIIQPTTHVQTFVEDEGFSVTVGTNTYDTTGVYTDVFIGSNGCDSIVITNLTIIPPCIVNIPDANFKNYLLNNSNINTNNDNEIQCSEADAFSGTIDVSNMNISDLTGIEAFTSLTYLTCFYNQLTSLDLSANTALTAFECSYNQLTSLEIPANSNITSLYCGYNQLTSLDLSSIPTLTYLYCRNNQLTSLNLSANNALTYLQCNNNQLTNLDLSASTSITSLRCSVNQLTSLNLSINNALTTIICSSNQLTSLNIRNENNINLISLNATGNPNLYCIQVDDTTFMNANFASGKDTSASFSENCVSIPVAPTDLTVNSLKNILSNMILSWTDNSNNEDGFRIYRSTDDVNYSEIGTTAANINTYTDSTGVASTLYYYRVTAYNSAGSSTFSNTANGITTGINEISENNVVSVYPNPTTGKLAVSLSNGNISTIEIYNLIGEKVYENNFNQQKPALSKVVTEQGRSIEGTTEIDISNSPCGIYFLKIGDGVKVYTSKIVVQ